MKNNGKLREWLWWLLPAFVLLAGGIYYFYDMARHAETELPVGETPPPVEQKRESETVNAPSVDKETFPDQGRPVSDTPAPSQSPEVTSDLQEKRDIPEFFIDLESRNYIQKLLPNEDPYLWFKGILKRLSLNPPVPAGESNDPGIILENITYFFRILTRKDIQLIKSIVFEEQEGLEMELHMFHRWLADGAGPPDLASLRPSKEIQYRFAGFFLNTIGGRAYLFRRTPRVRLLVTYYSILILYQRDKAKQNVFGIDVLPFLRQLKKELIHYTHLVYQENYMEQLRLMDAYYSQKR